MGEEKEPKPKKAFEIKVIIWDDGEIDSEMVEFRANPSGRGAPGKWRVNDTDFVRRIIETLGDPDTLLGTIHDMIGGAVAGTDQTKQLISTAMASVKAVPEASAEELAELDAEHNTEPEKEEKPNKKKKKASGSDDDGKMDFDGFDTDKKGE
jgi:hypothetical protein